MSFFLHYLHIHIKILNESILLEKHKQMGYGVVKNKEIKNV